MVFVSSVSVAKVADDWTERGKKGLVNQLALLKEIRQQENFSEGKPLMEVNKGLWYLYLLEMAYATHINPKFKGIVSYKGNGMEYYGIGLNLGTDETFALTIVYDEKTGDKIGHQILSLPTGWMLTTMDAKPGIIGLVNKDLDGYFFDVNNPLYAYVWADGKVYQAEKP